MFKLNLVNIANTVVEGLKENSGTVLAVMGVGGMLITVGMAIKATPKAVESVEEKKVKMEVEELTSVETVKTTWKYYIPTIISAGLSTVCILGSNSVNTKRNAALAAAYAISESTLKEYQEKVIETIGEKKEKELIDEIAKEKLKKDPVVSKEVLITGKGESLCYDSLSGRYFKSDIDKVRKAVNEINRIMINENYISLNQFYEELGLDGIGVGNSIGWNINSKLIDINFTSDIAQDGTPCLVLNYTHNPPQYGFENLYSTSSQKLQVL